MADRGRAVRGKIGYIPYTSLTRGEMELALLQQQAILYASAYPENKEYAKAAAMLDNALNAGVSNGVSFVGALHDPLLQQVARRIKAASRNTAPASNGLLMRDSIQNGVHIGDPIKFSFDHDCTQYATRRANAELRQNKKWTYYKAITTSEREKNTFKKYKAECETRIAIEAIVNQKIGDASHHVIYYGLEESFPSIKNSLVATKKLLHIGGVQALGNATDTNTALMSLWSETSILSKNSSAGVGTIGSLASSLYLSPDPEAFIAGYEKFTNSKIIDRLPGMQGIGVIPIAAITALVSAIGVAIKQAADMQRALNEKKAGAMSAAQSYGTAAFEAKQTDFNDPPLPGGTGSSSNLLLLALGAAAYLILEK